MGGMSILDCGGEQSAIAIYFFILKLMGWNLSDLGLAWPGIKPREVICHSLPEESTKSSLSLLLELFWFFTLCTDYLGYGHISPLALPQP